MIPYQFTSAKIEKISNLLKLNVLKMVKLFLFVAVANKEYSFQSKKTNPEWKKYNSISEYNQQS